MSRRSWIYLIGVVLICSLAGAAWYVKYNSKCHGIDACAAQSAEGRERDTPLEPR